MSWFKKEKLSWFQRLCLNVLKQGAIPEHVAFIMDGNRRFASKKKLESIDGHIIGFDKLTQTLEWCMQLGIREVTVYAFSIENFKRSKNEVQGLMELAEEKLRDLIQEKEKIFKHGLCIKVAGDLALLPTKLQQLIGEVVLMTENNNRMLLNVCLSYTSRHEISAAVEDLADGVSNGLIQPNDINESLLTSSLLVTSEPDLVLRTSGEIRLSDYLLWQSGYSVLAFLKVLWPEFAIWHLFLGVLFYQFSCKHSLKTKVVHKALTKEMEDKDDLVNAYSEADLITRVNGAENWEHIEEFPPTTQQDILAVYKDKQNQRRECFLDYMKEKRRQQFIEMRAQSI